MGLSRDIVYSDRVSKDDDISHPMQFPMMVTVPGNSSCVPPNVTLGVNSTVLNMVNRSENIDRKQTNRGPKQPNKRRSSFWHLPCVIIVGILINPAFGLAAAFVFSLETSNGAKKQKKLNKTLRRTGIGLVVIGIIVSLWIWSAVLIYHYAVFTVRAQLARQPNYAVNKWQRNTSLPIATSTRTASKSVDIAGNSEIQPSSSPTESEPWSSQVRVEKYTTGTPVLLTTKLMRYSTETGYKSPSSPDTAWGNSLSSNSKQPSTDSSKSTLGKTNNTLPSTHETVTAQMTTVANTQSQYSTGFKETTKALTSSVSVFHTTLSSTSTKSKGGKSYSIFREAMDRFASVKSIVGL